jgi:hypothetical protein
VAAAWRSLSKSIGPSDVAHALMKTLECHIVNLYRRGMAWIVIYPDSFIKPAVIPVFDRGANRIRSPFSRYWKDGMLWSTARFRECRKWPETPFLIDA